ncbi:hypothetical protein [Aquabacterium sp.]|uniref:hypothetical protein n=1 Tax=Aquabacterium sp. TaxID=1872578 RepID=UPI003D6D0219
MGKMNQMSRKGMPFGAVLFNVVEEANKVLAVVRKAPTKHRTKCDDTDLEAMGFKESKIGFFVLLMPGQVGSGKNFSFVVDPDQRREAHEVLSKLNVFQLTEGVLACTSASSWDVAKRKLQECECLGYFAVAFSTPDQLMILAEDPKFMVL